jgi:hypothetical protein
MVLWLIALCLLASLAVIGYYQGGIRVAFSLVGLLLAAVLALPLGKLIRPVFPVFGITHPVLVAFLAPAVVFLLLLVIFKVAALAVHKKTETYYKYRASETQRALFERLNQRLGICLGLANATVYVFLIGTVAYVVGYFTLQVASSEGDGWPLRLVNRLNSEMKKSGFVRAAAHFSPATEFYYDACDVLGDIFHNPLRQDKVSTYPVFLNLTERPEFKALSESRFQQFWQRQRTLGEVMNHERVKPLVHDVKLYTNLVAMLSGDLKDLKSYLETGKSPKYDEDKILGRWKFDYRETYGLARKGKPNLTLQELNRMRRFLSGFNDTEFLATVDHKAALRITANNNTQAVQGNWKNRGGGKFGLTIREGGSGGSVEASADATRLSFTWAGYTFVFKRA